MLENNYYYYYNRKQRFAKDKLTASPLPYGLPIELSKRLPSPSLSWGASVLERFSSRLRFDSLIGVTDDSLSNTTNDARAKETTQRLRSSQFLPALTSLTRAALTSGVSFYLLQDNDDEQIITIPSSHVLYSSKVSIVGGFGLQGLPSVSIDNKCLPMFAFDDNVDASGDSCVMILPTCGVALSGGVDFIKEDDRGSYKLILDSTNNKNQNPKIENLENTPTLSRSFIIRELSTLSSFVVINGNIASFSLEIKDADRLEMLDTKTLFELFAIHQKAESEGILSVDNDEMVRFLSLFDGFLPDVSMEKFGALHVNSKKFSTYDLGSSIFSRSFESAYKAALDCKAIMDASSFMSSLNRNLIIAQGIEKETTDSRTGETDKQIESQNGKDFSGVPTLYAKSPTAEVSVSQLAEVSTNELRSSFTDCALSVCGELGIAPELLGVSAPDNFKAEFYDKIFNDKVASLRQELAPQILDFALKYLRLNGFNVDGLENATICFEPELEISTIAGIGDAIFKAQAQGIRLPDAFIRQIFGISAHMMDSDSLRVPIVQESAPSVDSKALDVD